MYEVAPHMSNPPLILALAKVEFAKLPQAKLEGSIEALHDMLREEYPDLQQGLSSSVNLNLSNKDNGELSSDLVEEKVPFWVLRSADSDWAMRIDNTSILVTTKSYVSSEDLCERVCSVLQAISEAVKITHTRYIGVRFVNKINHNDQGHFSALRPGFIQEALPFSDGMGGSSYNSRYKIGEGWLDIRSHLVVGGYEVTEDLRDVAALVNVAKSPVNEVFVTLDFDCKFVIENYEKYDLSVLKDRIMTLTYKGKEALAHVLTEDEINQRR